MSLTKFSIINAVIEFGSLTKAAANLGLTQSAVSHAITSLEGEWGFPLIKRERSGIRLTANGERMIKHIRKVLKEYEQLQQEVAAINGLEIGTIRIGTFTTVSSQWLPGIIKQFQEEYPFVEIKLMEGETYEEIEQWLLDGSIDFGFSTVPSSPSLDFIPLKKDKMCCVVPINHHFGDKSCLSLEDIKEERFIMPKWGNDNHIIQSLKKKMLQVKFEISDDQAILSMVRHGLGISILPEMVMLNLRKSDIRLIDLEGDSYRTIGIATPSLKKLSPAASKFIAVIQFWLKEQQLLDY
ncbi:MAG: LysR family transcriptional regulator [Bacillus sp. (in: firmicutes)]